MKEEKEREREREREREKKHESGPARSNNAFFVLLLLALH